MKKADRYSKVIDRFERSMPEAQTELHFDNPYQLLVAVILSAQCTDKRVNIITPPLFERFPTAADLATAKREEVFELIKSCSYPNNKTTSLLGMARMLTERFGGKVPDSIDDLMSLPGVGRKTANVILSVVYDKPAMAVDTHVFRVAERIGLTTNSRTPLTTERELVKYIPEEKIARAHHWLILHGRYVCKARKPLCDQCEISQYCRYYEKLNKDT
ncbi:MAG: endonuclease III [Muribaculaceae bacterium]|nr:endonuclease III [Muribaculaceae bacterium]